MSSLHEKGKSSIHFNARNQKNQAQTQQKETAESRTALGSTTLLFTKLNTHNQIQYTQGHTHTLSQTHTDNQNYLHTYP